MNSKERINFKERLIMNEQDGKILYEAIVHVTGKNPNGSRIYNIERIANVPGVSYISSKGRELAKEFGESAICESRHGDSNLLKLKIIIREI